MLQQLFIHREVPDASKIEPIVNRENWMKPDGGLWTSTYINRTSGWVKWCRDNKFSSPSAYSWWLLTPQRSIRVYTIDSYAGLELCLHRYGRRFTYADIPSFRNSRYIDFESMAKEYDGLHLTERGNEQTHLSHPNDLNIWDCESTLWFRWVFSRMRNIRAGK